MRTPLVSLGFLPTEFGEMYVENLAAYLGGFLGAAVPNVAFLNNLERLVRRVAYWAADFPGAQERVYSLIAGSNVTTSEELERDLFGVADKDAIGVIKEKLGERTQSQLMKIGRIRDALRRDKFPFGNLSQNVKDRFSASIYAVNGRLRDIKQDLGKILESEDESQGEERIQNVRKSIEGLYFSAAYICACAVASQSQTSRTRTAQTLNSMGLNVTMPPAPADYRVLVAVFFSCAIFFGLDFFGRTLVREGFVSLDHLVRNCPVILQNGIGWPGFSVKFGASIVGALRSAALIFFPIYAFVLSRRGFIEKNSLTWRSDGGDRIRPLSAFGAALAFIVVATPIAGSQPLLDALAADRGKIQLVFNLSLHQLDVASVARLFVVPFGVLLIVWSLLERSEYSSKERRLATKWQFPLVLMSVSVLIGGIHVVSSVENLGAQITSTSGEIALSNCVFRPIAVYEFISAITIFATCLIFGIERAEIQ